SGDGARRRRARRAGARPLRERRARLLASHRAGEGPACRPRPRCGASRHGRQRRADPGCGGVTVDALTFVGESLFGPAATVDELLGMLDETEIERAVVCPLRPRSYRLEDANDTVAAAVGRHPDRLVGFARVDPNQGDDAAAELARATGELGLRGLFLHPWEETFRIHDERVVALLDGFALPVIVAAGYPWLSEGAQVGELARLLPEVDIVATNGCQINISGLGQTDAEL